MFSIRSIRKIRPVSPDSPFWRNALLVILAITPLASGVAAVCALDVHAASASTSCGLPVQNEIACWLGHASESYNPPVEDGTDFALPVDTPIYAVESGPVLGTGTYPGGGVVSIQVGAQVADYYQHLDCVDVKQGDVVSAGQLIGTSGGELSSQISQFGTSQCGLYASAYSSGPHIEFGLNAPYGSFWNPNKWTPNVDPVPQSGTCGLPGHCLKDLETTNTTSRIQAQVTVFRPSTGTWYFQALYPNPGWAVQFGQNGDIPVPGDYLGTGKNQIAVFRPSTGTWYFQGRTVQFGQNGDIPVPGDYLGNGTTQIAVFRPSNGTWYFQALYPNQGWAVPFGKNGDIPVPGDYLGTGKTQIVVFRPSTGAWYNQAQYGTSAWGLVFGQNGDIPVPGDYLGTGKTQIGCSDPRPAHGTTKPNMAPRRGA